MSLGDLLGAGVLCERSVALFAEAGDLYMRDQVLLMVGNALLAQGDETGARTLIEDLIDGSDAGHSFWMAGWVLCAYGEIALQQGDGSRARFLLEQALAQSHRVGNRSGMARAYSLLAQVALAAQNLTSARDNAAQSLQIAGSVGDKETIIGCLEGIADIAARNGQMAWATRLWGAAERQRETARKEPAAAEQRSGKPLVETACSAIGRQLFDEMWSEGRSLTPEQALNDCGLRIADCGLRIGDLGPGVRSQRSEAADERDVSVYNPQSAIRAQHSRKITAHCADGTCQPEDHEHIRNPQSATGHSHRSGAIRIRWKRDCLASATGLRTS
jgi:hypothetical protein